MRKHTECVRKFVAEVASIGGSAYIQDNVLTVSVGASEEKFDDTLFNVQMILYVVPGGHSWGTDGVGYLANKEEGIVRVKKCLPKSVVNEFKKIDPDMILEPAWA